MSFYFICTDHQTQIIPLHGLLFGYTERSLTNMVTYIICNVKNMSYIFNGNDTVSSFVENI